MGFIERQVNHVPRRRTQFVLLCIPFHGTTVTLAKQRLKVKIAVICISQADTVTVSAAAVVEYDGASKSLSPSSDIIIGQGWQM